jgi:hypothetical protein
VQALTTLALTLLLALMTSTVLLPAPASAEVDKKYAKAYANELRFASNAHVSFQAMANAFTEGLPDAFMQLEQLLALDQTDPSVQEQINEYKGWTRGEYDEYMSTWSRRAAKYEKAVSRFHDRVKRMFSDDTDKIRVRRLARRWTLGAGDLVKAFNSMAVSWYYLSQLDMASALTEKDAANRLIESAKPSIEKALAGLRRLRR